VDVRVQSEAWLLRSFRATSVATILLFTALLIGGVCRLYVVVADDGVYWPDEIYQSIEPAHRLVFRYGLVGWEFAEGARNWALPGALAGILWLTAALGGGSPEVYLAVVRILFVGLSLGSAVGVHRIVVNSGGSSLAGAVGAWTWSLAAPSIYFAHRALSENAASAAGVWAVALLSGLHLSRRHVIVGGSLLGIAILVRLQMGLLALGLLGVLAARRNWPALRGLLIVLAVWAVVFGVLDAFTWGHLPTARYGGWFHSAFTYLHFNVVDERSAQFGTAPASYYWVHIFRSMPFIAATLVAGLVIGLWRSSRAASLLGVLIVAGHSLVGHKELRFILPALPIAIAAAALAFDRGRPVVRAAGLGALGAAALVSATTFPFLTWGQLGSPVDRGDVSAWDRSGPVNRLLLEAHTLPDLCGLRVDMPAEWHGGLSRLHRNVRLYRNLDPASQAYNYAIIAAGSGRAVVAREGDWELVKFPEVRRCIRTPEYDWSL
jgi:hypothetical protein